jgi:hypothetical protein
MVASGIHQQGRRQIKSHVVEGRAGT